MKTSININLFGTLYAIDEDAHQLLRQYLDNMKSYFSKQEGGDEISDDIEHRVAELFWELKQAGNESITTASPSGATISAPSTAGSATSSRKSAIPKIWVDHRPATKGDPLTMDKIRTMMVSNRPTEANSSSKR